MKPRLEAVRLTKSYRRGPQQVDALKEVSLSIGAGEFVCLMGPSGSGKSTFLHLVGGLDSPTSGSVVLDGQAIEAYSDAELSRFRRHKLGFIFQFFNLMPTMTALENVALPLLLDGQPMQKLAPKARELLGAMGIAERAQHLPSQLSGGEMQRVAIARALLSDPLVLLADEPTGNLDSKSGELVLELLHRTVKERNQTLIMVTHDAKAASYGSRLIQLKDGQVCADGPQR